LTFESFPEIILQLYILNYLRNSPEELELLDVTLLEILISVSLSIVHSLVEMMFVSLEKKANKTTWMHYLIICFNGRFGFVPFTNHFSQEAQQLV